MGIYYSLREDPFQRASESGLAKKTRTLIESKKHRKYFLLDVHRYLTYAMIVLGVIMFHIERTQGYLEPYRYDWKAFLNLLPWSLGLQFGLYLSTLHLGARIRFLTALLILPSFGFALAASDIFGDFFGILMAAYILWSCRIVLWKERMVYD